MYTLNKLEKEIYWIFIISLIIDNINGFILINKIDLPISVGQIYRYFMIAYFLYHIIKSKNKKTIIKMTGITIYLLILTIIYFIAHNSRAGFIMDVIYIIKLIYPFIIIYALQILYYNKRITTNVIDKIFRDYSIFAPLTLIIPKILGLGYDSYNLGGYKGFYFANNEINVLLVCTYIYSMNVLYKNNKIKDALLVIINAVALFLIGSKTSLIVIAMVLLIYIIKMRKKTKWFLGMIIFTIIGICIGGVVFSTQIIEMRQRFEYFYKTLINQGGILTFLTSTRNLRIIPAFQKNILNVGIGQGIINFTIGIGRYQQVNPKSLRTLMELDLFDTFYWYGFITAIFILKEYITPFVRTIKIKRISEYKLMFIIVFLFSMIAGHVWYSALAGEKLALVCAMLVMNAIKDNEREEKS